jgi:hypothetical protein
MSFSCHIFVDRKWKVIFFAHLLQGLQNGIVAVCRHALQSRCPLLLLLISLLCRRRSRQLGSSFTKCEKRRNGAVGQLCPPLHQVLHGLQPPYMGVSMAGTLDIELTDPLEFYLVEQLLLCSYLFRSEQLLARYLEVVERAYTNSFIRQIISCVTGCSPAEAQPCIALTATGSSALHCDSRDGCCRTDACLLPKLCNEARSMRIRHGVLLGREHRT